MKEYREIIKELNDRHIDILNLEIAYELSCQLDYSDNTFTEEQQTELLETISNAYLKSEDLSIEAITRAAIKNADKIFNDDLSTWDLIEEACWA